jgi:hypothetical protein
VRKAVFFLSIFALIACNCGQAMREQEKTEMEDTLKKSVVALIGDRQVENLEDIHDFPFSENEIACPFGNGLYGKFPLKQKWTTISFRRNQIIIAETQQNFYDDDWKNLYTSLAEQGYEQKSDFDIAFKGICSKKDFEFLTLSNDNNNDIINLIKHNMPIDISVKEFWKKHNPKYEMKPFEITNIQPYFFLNSENKIWIAYCRFRFLDYEEEYTGLIGVTAKKEVVLLSGYCVYEEDSVYLLRFKGNLFLFVKNDTCGEGAIITTRLYKLTENFEKIYDETIVYD